MNRDYQWTFTDHKGSFKLESPEMSSYLYFPLANEAGMMSSITPTLNGDAKTGQNTFALTPVSAEDLHNTKSGRNFWAYIEGKGAWSAVGASAMQQSTLFSEDKEKTLLEAGILWHKVTRESKKYGIKSEVLSFVPTTKEQIELTKVTLTNISNEKMMLTSTAAVPLYGRSADNLRDHRHVTSLLHRIYTTKDGIVIKPTLTFDERGHRMNEVAYGVLGRDGVGRGPIGYFPVVEDYIGEGGNLENPQAVVDNIPPNIKEGEYFEAYETIGALRFRAEELLPGESKEYIFAIVIDEKGQMFKETAEKYLSIAAFDKFLADSVQHWEEKLNLSFKSGDSQFDGWMRWVTFQPVLRRIYGCSFLPHHDYGRGGRGWRDLWQDCLALLIMDPKEVKEMLHSYYGGVRFDGTNATIIGKARGEFIADRNNITRVWMDHGAWPFLTTKLYIEQSGDTAFLLEKMTYFKDRQIFRGTKKDEVWREESGKYQQSHDGKIYEGSILEHLLVQHLTAFYDVGEHNNIKLNGADWNDGLDMAQQKGESVAFTALYCSNLIELARFIEVLKEKNGKHAFPLAKELVLLLKGCNYESAAEKRKLLGEYLEAVQHAITGERIEIESDALIESLEEKARWLAEHIRKNEWISNEDGYKWFNGYYDNNGRRVEGDHEQDTRMMLTSQVFTIMGGISEEAQTKEIIKAARHYLYDEAVGGYRLNTSFKEVKTDLGRLFGFGYGHKENGAVFSHMTIMYGNALYKRGYVKEGFEVLNTLYSHCCDFKKSRIYPGIPEYINEKGRGMYHYLTGSASWLMLTVLTEMFGVKGDLGDLKLEPKLLKEQFDKQGLCSVSTVFADKNITVIYRNSEKLEYGNYTIQKILLNKEQLLDGINQKQAVISRNILAANEQKEIIIEATLGK